MDTTPEYKELPAGVKLTQILLMLDVNVEEPPFLFVRDFQCGPTKTNGYYLSGELLDISDSTLAKMLGIGSKAFTSQDQYPVIQNDFLSPLKVTLDVTKIAAPSITQLQRGRGSMLGGRYSNGIVMYQICCLQDRKQEVLQAILQKERERATTLLQQAAGRLRGLRLLAEKSCVDLSSNKEPQSISWAVGVAAAGLPNTDAAAGAREACATITDGRVQCTDTVANMEGMILHLLDIHQVAVKASVDAPLASPHHPLNPEPEPKRESPQSSPSAQDGPG